MELDIPYLLASKKAFLRPSIDDHASFLEYHKATVSRTGYNQTTESKLPNLKLVEVTQDDFIKERNPQTHRIYDRATRPDIPITDNGQPPTIKDLQEGKQKIVAYAMRSRVALPEQIIIAERQLVHLFGNTLDFSLFKGDKDAYSKFKKYWDFYHVHDGLMSTADSALNTGDGAIIFYIEGGDMKFDIWSYAFGDSVSHHEKSDRNPECDVRLYQSSDKEDETITVCEVYTDLLVHTYHQNTEPSSDSDEEWTLQGEPEKHGLQQSPVSYHKEMDVAWGSVQTLIETQEESLSDLREANKKVGQDIIVIKSDGVDVMPNMAAGVNIIDVGEDGDASKLEAQGEPVSFLKEFEKLQNMERASTGTVVIPPEMLKGGDHSGAYIKNLYFPAIQKAVKNLPDWHPFIQKCISVVAEISGVLEKKPSDFRTLKVGYRIKPYVPENRYESAQINQLGVLGGFISAEDATENTPGNSPDAWEKIKTEKKSQYDLKFGAQKELD